MSQKHKRVAFHVAFSADSLGADCTCCARNGAGAILAEELVHIEGVHSVFVSEKQGIVSIDYDPNQITPPTLTQVLEDLGCSPTERPGVVSARRPVYGNPGRNVSLLLLGIKAEGQSLRLGSCCPLAVSPRSN